MNYLNVFVSKQFAINVHVSFSMSEITRTSLIVRTEVFVSLEGTKLKAFPCRMTALLN